MDRATSTITTISSIAQELPIAEDLLERVADLIEDLNRFTERLQVLRRSWRNNNNNNHDDCPYKRVAEVNLQWFTKYPVCPAIVVVAAAGTSSPPRRCGGGRFQKVATLLRNPNQGQEINLGCEEHPWETLPPYRDYKHDFEVAKVLDEAEFADKQRFAAEQVAAAQAQMKSKYAVLLARLDVLLEEWRDARGHAELQQLYNKGSQHLQTIKRQFVKTVSGVLV